VFLVVGDVRASAILNVSVEATVTHKLIRGLPCVVRVIAASLFSAEDISLEGLATLPVDEQKQRLENSLRAERAFPLFEFFDVRVPFELEVLDAAGQPIESPNGVTIETFYAMDLELIDPPVPFGQLMRPTLSLGVGESRDLVVDLWPWLKELAPGEYTITLLLFSSTLTEPWRSNPLNITIEEVSGSVFSDIAGGIPALAEKGFDLTAEEWIDPNVDSQRLQEVLPPELFQVLVLHAFLGEVAKNGSVDGAPVELLDELPSHLASLREAINYEIQRPGLTEPEAEQLAAQIRATFPGIGWRLDEVDQGRGLLNTVIKRSSN